MDTIIPPGNNAEARQKAFKGYPRGWFVVSFSDELKVGDVHTLNYFGKKYALYRGDDGVPRIMDAYCPHLGGSLARGKVNGDSLVCPFHGSGRTASATTSPTARASRERPWWTPPPARR